MKVTTENGTPTVDAHDLGALLDLPPDRVQAGMRSSAITSRFETGVDEDAGRMRLTFRYNGKRVRLTCTGDGEVLSTVRVTTGDR
ncbi:hypothetical protein KX928_22010 [Roseobacter sp. YSTF-M11]|uniref:Halobacterial output domain-containing protein n=1 Tax=Roseobacter insulae TaxID=2859783 RepID=A0A9X1K2P3_9RHOB|nr:DUF6522 family protein [Roseobacter insulae]MBW4710474.1 hypothetical protein [Roseobacter insulae]